MTTWMLVEDEPDLYDMMLAMYTTLGVTGVSFVTGEDAIEWIEEVDSGLYTEQLPELALIDIRLPDEISGPMIGARLRQSPTMSRIPIVLMTAYHLTAQEEKSILKQAGADMLLYKPLPKQAELAQTFRNLINRNQPKPARAARRSRNHKNNSNHSQ